jgi:hypothetical protein
MLIGGSANAQNYENIEKKNDSVGVVNILQDERIDQLLATDSIINSQKQSFTGYRIQIFLEVVPIEKKLSK